MPTLLIEDFLQTQGLKLPPDDVRAAYAAVSAVINLGNASIERSLLWLEKDGFRLAGHIAQTAENESVLKQVFMALDSVYSRQSDVKSAAVYAYMPSETPAAKLVLLTQQGFGLEHCLNVDDDNSRTYLACRTAQSGWLNIADDIARWLDLGEISGERNLSCAAQVSVPVCTKSGAVIGVLHIEFKDKNPSDKESLAEWVGLSLALAEPLKTLLNVGESEEEHHE